MTFDTLPFIAFFAIVVLLHRLLLAWSVKKFNLLIASHLSYAAWNPPFVILLWFSTAVDWKVARWIKEAQRLEADLIVIATHGHGAMFDLLVGSISQAVLRQSRAPVAMVPVR